MDKNHWEEKEYEITSNLTLSISLFILYIPYL